MNRKPQPEPALREDDLQFRSAQHEKLIRQEQKSNDAKREFLLNIYYFLNFHNMMLCLINDTNQEHQMYNLVDHKKNYNNMSERYDMKVLLH